MAAASKGRYGKLTMAARYPTTLGGQARRQAGRYVLGTAILAAQQALMFGRDMLFKRGVDAATGSEGHGHEAVMAAAAAMGVVIVAGGLRVLSRVVLFNAGRAAEYELRAMLLDRLHELGPSFFRKIPTGDILSRSTNDLTQVRLLLGFGVLNVVNTVFALISALSLMIGISGRLTLAALLPAPLLMLLTRWFSRQMFTRMRDTQESLGQLSGRVQSSLAGIRVVRSLALEPAELKAFGQASDRYLEKSLGLAKIRGAMGPIMGAVSSVGLLIVFWYGGSLVLEHRITQGDFVAFWAGLGRLIWPMVALGFVASILQRGRVSYQRLEQIFVATPEVVTGEGPAPAVWPERSRCAT